MKSDIHPSIKSNQPSYSSTPPLLHFHFLSLFYLSFVFPFSSLLGQSSSSSIFFSFSILFFHFLFSFEVVKPILYIVVTVVYITRSAIVGVVRGGCRRWVIHYSVLLYIHFLIDRKKNIFLKGMWCFSIFVYLIVSFCLRCGGWGGEGSLHIFVEVFLCLSLSLSLCLWFCV